MSKIKDDLAEQRYEHDEELKNIATTQSSEQTPSITEIAPELVSLSAQANAAQARLEQQLQAKDLYPRYDIFDYSSFSMPSPYGKISGFFIPSDSDFLNVAYSYTDSEKAGRKFLKQHNIKTQDKALAGEITNYLFSQSIATYIEQNKSRMSSAEYNECHQESQEALLKSIKLLNKKGFIVNPQTGDLEYQNPALQRALLAQNR